MSARESLTRFLQNTPGNIKDNPAPAGIIKHLGILRENSSKKGKLNKLNYILTEYWEIKYGSYLKIVCLCVSLFSKYYT